MNESNTQSKTAKALLLLYLLLCLLGPAYPAWSGSRVFENGLVAHWAFNEMAGKVVQDSSVQGLNGSLMGGTWTRGAAIYDGAVRFSGTNEALFIPAPNIPPPDRIGALPFGSLVLRFRFAPTGSGEVIPVFYFGERHADASDSALIVEIGHGGDPANRRLYFTIFVAGFCFDSGTNLLPNTWYHFVGLVSPNGNTGYLNGQEMTNRHYNLGSNPAYTNFFSSVPARDCLTMAYGRFSGNTNFTYGAVTLSDVQVYDRQLSPLEIGALYADVNDTGVFKIDPTVVITDAGLNLRWPSAPNYVYSVFSADSMLSPVWQPLPGLTNLAASPPLNAVLIPVAPNQQTTGFFRVQAAWPSP
ncbi:MAG TPA: LamG-like jellyroll fold domain-containing protein [Candidatus Limnocylindrales bacterium]|jgi:hypothetical protein|nr:LamG-like jellyroll fold domain-containing protein [Candidatus Limnocylindrales bacterium]